MEDATLCPQSDMATLPEDVSSSLPETRDIRPRVSGAMIVMHDLHEIVPENMQRKELYFHPQSSSRHPVVKHVETNRPIRCHVERMEVQSEFCYIVGIDDATMILHDLCTEKVPANVVPYTSDTGDQMICWFTINNKEKLVIVDLMEWIAFPHFFFIQFPCLCITERAKKRKLMQECVKNLSNLIDKNASNISSKDYMDMCDCMHQLYSEDFKRQ